MHIYPVVRHKLSNIDEEKKTANCDVCKGAVPIKFRTQGTGIPGNWTCRKRLNFVRNRRRKPYLASRADHCENPNCECVIVDVCQLDVDHKDGDHENDSPENLWTLCANCHRLKTSRPDLFWKEDYLTQ